MINPILTDGENGFTLAGDLKVLKQDHLLNFPRKKHLELKLPISS